MSNLQTIISEIANQLESNGAVYSQRPLQTLASAMSFLQAFGISVDDDIYSAAIAATMLQPEDACSVVKRIGIEFPLVPSIEPAIFGYEPQLARFIQNGDHRQAVVAATMLFVWYSTAAQRGDSNRLRKIHGVVELLANNGLNQDIGKSLLAEIDKVVDRQPPESLPDSNALFSISIDLVGSTAAKSNVMRAAIGDHARIDELNVQIYPEFCRIEREFYKLTGSPHSQTSPIPLDKFFTVKGIGDEVWILCEVPSDKLIETGHSLINAGMNIAVRAVDFLATQNNDGPDFDPKFDYGNIEPIKSPIKVFIDIVDNATDLGALRDEKLRREIPDLLRASLGREPTTFEISNAARRLCFHSFEELGWSSIQMARTDFIGHSIDRFFRTTKATIPGTVTIGESMAKQMSLKFSPKTQGVHSVNLNESTPLHGGFPWDPLCCVVRILEADEMKGIGYAYSTYTLFAPRSLKGCYVQMHADLANGFIDKPYGDTEKLISSEVLDELVNEILGRTTSNSED